MSTESQSSVSPNRWRRHQRTAALFRSRRNRVACASAFESVPASVPVLVSVRAVSERVSVPVPDDEDRRRFRRWVVPVPVPVPADADAALVVPLGD
ncbi:hypothetical protein C481_07951 [Natrialba asiatica DSM 12278]|uniref:Uncharacterized protein n=1 Tax=Natrialba asiatica (strain ATCC 700177 / DSM 12278 / JCM 9576 / FERM P-10747 / NBRC 102637 / 172P1) TaxID=29540 RepID=M0AYU7_NATA1|nr:hypothetical protein C481_07951 [Natrialba asiatica DSM 12278]